jgi:hypothetical protein
MMAGAGQSAILAVVLCVGIVAADNTIRASNQNLYGGSMRDIMIERNAKNFGACAAAPVLVRHLPRGLL